MSLCIDKRSGYAKLDTFCFTIGGNVNSETVIDFGDGSVEKVAGRYVVCHIYDNYGLYQACLRTCDGGELLDKCMGIVVKPYVEESLEIIESTNSGLASKEEANTFKVRVTTTCAPPVKLKVWVEGTITKPKDSLADTLFSQFLPKHYFISDEKIEDGYFILDDMSKILVDGIIVAWTKTFSFGFYDDYPSVKNIKLRLEKSCDLNPTIDWSALNSVENSCYLNCLEHEPLIDPDLGF